MMSQNILMQTPAEEASVKPIRLQQINEGAGQGASIFDGNLSLIQGVKVKLEVVVGQTELTIGELFGLKDQAVVKLDAATHAPVDVRLDGKTIARGHLVVVDDNLGVCIEEILPASPV
jgi:flagellar motor switch protein FliN